MHAERLDPRSLLFPDQNKPRAIPFFLLSPLSIFFAIYVYGLSPTASESLTRFQDSSTLLEADCSSSMGRVKSHLAPQLSASFVFKTIFDVKFFPSPRGRGEGKSSASSE